MSLKDRIKQIMKENDLKQKEFAESIGVSESYISAIVNERNRDLSKPLAMLIEEKYGYATEWTLNGTSPKMNQFSKNKAFSDVHHKALRRLEKMDDSHAKAVLAFIQSLEEVESILKEQQ